MGLVVVLAIRLTVPLAILRWPFAGSLLALAVDVADIIIFQLTDFPAFPYQRFDKILDVYYIALQAIVAQRWEPALRWTANGLCAYRLIGTALYEGPVHGRSFSCFRTCLPSGLSSAPAS
jgi:hypothetical protein